VIKEKGFTDKTLNKFISSSYRSTKKIAILMDGKIYSGCADQSKSNRGVKYNRLIRLSAKLRKTGKGEESYG